MGRQRRAFGKIKQLPSKRFQASYAGPDGRRHLAPTTYLVRKDAERWLMDEERMIDRGDWSAPDERRPVPKAPEVIHLKAWAPKCLDRRQARARNPLRQTTRDNYDRLLRLAILPRLGTLPLDKITPAKVAQWYDDLPSKTPTQNGNAYMLLRSLMQDAVDSELIDRNPCRIKGAGKPQPKHEGQALNKGELAVYGAHVGDDFLLPLMIAAWCALRSGEVRALRRCDVSEDGTWIHVRQTLSRIGTGQDRRWHIGPPKTAAGIRDVAVPPHLIASLLEHCDAWDATHLDPKGLLFPAPDGVSPMGESALRTAHKRGAVAIDKPDLTVHDLRRTGATLAAQTGSTVREVMRMLGHTTATVAMIYQVAADERDVERARRMSTHYLGYDIATPALET